MGTCSLQDASAGLTDDTAAEFAVSRDLSLSPLDGHQGGDVTLRTLGPRDDRASLRDHLLGHPDERAIRGHLLIVSLLRGHALDLLRPAPCRARDS